MLGSSGDRGGKPTMATTRRRCTRWSMRTGRRPLSRCRTAPVQAPWRAPVPGRPWPVNRGHRVAPPQGPKQPSPLKQTRGTPQTEQNFPTARSQSCLGWSTTRPGSDTHVAVVKSGVAAESRSVRIAGGAARFGRRTSGPYPDCRAVFPVGCACRGQPCPTIFVSASGLSSRNSYKPGPKSCPGKRPFLRSPCARPSPGSWIASAVACGYRRRPPG